MTIAPENTSGQGGLAVIPEEIKGWNWGAFFFGWLWGICNKVWIALLAAIPYVGVIMHIVLGVKRNEWAWQHKRWDSMEHFKSTQKKWGIAGVVVFVASVIILVIAIALPAGCVSPSLEAPIPTQEIEAGWIRIEIKDVGSIDYPTDFLELQSEEYRDIAQETYQILKLGKSDFTLQQVSLNELLPSAFDEYRRVVFRTVYMDPGEEVFRANEKYTVSQEELAELQNEAIDQLLREFVKLKTIGSETKLVESISLEVVEVNGMFPMVHTYTRQLNDNPIVLVKSYLFWNYDRIHGLAFSCRVVDEEECRDIYDKILDSFRLR